jgi:hypothetical protein
MTMACLNDADLQAVVDGESTLERLDHAAACDRCRARVEDRRRDMARIVAMANDAAAPSSLESRVREATASPAAVRGATALRDRTQSRRSRWWLSSAAAAAAVIVVVFVVLPRLGSPTSLSAAQVLGRSIDRMTMGTGVEILEYELVSDSTYRIYQLFDRSNRGRYHIRQYNPDGTLHSAISQDPATHSRTTLIAIDGRNYIVRITSLKEPLVSIPEMLQAQVEAVLTMLQARSDQSLAVVDRPEGKQYVVETNGRSLGDKAMLDVFSARAVIDGGDFTIREFHAAGQVLKQPFDLSFRLIQQVKAAAVSPGSFDITPGPDDVVLEGPSSGDPLHEGIDIVLRELGRSRVPLR